MTESQCTDNIKKIVIIIPAFNEEGTVQQTIRGIKAFANDFAERSLLLQIYVIDDGSSDKTAQLAKDAGCDRLIRHKTNLGLGAAVRTGLHAAGCDNACVAVKYDADLQHEPSDILPLITPILDDEAEVVYGNRFEKIEYKMPFVRFIGNRSFMWLMRSLTHWPLKDSQPGILAVSRDYLKVFHLPGDYNYTQQILLDAYHKGMRFAHVPVTFRERKKGKSFISLKYPFKVLPQLLMVLVSVKPFNIFGPIGLAFLLLGGSVFFWEIFQWMQGQALRPVAHVNFVLGSVFFGLQTFFFGLLAELVVRMNNRK